MHIPRTSRSISGTGATPSLLRRRFTPGWPAVRVALTCSPLPGLRARENLAVPRDAWLARRPQDEVDGFPVSDGIAMRLRTPAPTRFSLAPELPVELGGPGERHFAHVDGASVLFDYTEVFDGIPRPGRPVSSRLIGADLAWA